MKKAHIIAAIAACLAIFYFLPVSIPYKICLTVGVLAIGSIGSLPWLMVLAFVFSCTGDAMGAAHSFPLQMLSFMLAHISMIIFFCSRLKGKKVITDTRSIGTLLVLICIIALSFTKIVPNAPEGFIRIGVGTYSVLLSLMCWTAALQNNKIVATGAFLFLVSDLILAWNKFTSPIPYAHIVLMIPYYAGQIGLFLGVNQITNTSCESRE